MTPEEFKALRDDIAEVNFWLRVIAGPLMKERLEPLLLSASERRVYQASTGVTQSEVAKASGVAQSTVSSLWKKWDIAGVMRTSAATGRPKRLLDLTSIGFDVDA